MQGLIVKESILIETLMLVSVELDPQMQLALKVIKAMRIFLFLLIKFFFISSLSWNQCLFGKGVNHLKSNSSLKIHNFKN